jgi:hypothetical protein
MPPHSLHILTALTLYVRVTPSGIKAFVFEAKLGRQTIRRTIGDVRSWTTEGARTEANLQRVLVDQGANPRELEREKHVVRKVQATNAAAEVITVGEAWKVYVEARKPRWGALHDRDHLAKAKAVRLTAVRGTRWRKETIAGPLYPLMALLLRELTPATISRWA